VHIEIKQPCKQKLDFRRSFFSGSSFTTFLMGNRQSQAVPPRSPAASSQPVSPDDAVYETYQVPLGLAREINRLCSEFQRLQQTLRSGDPLPAEATFEVDLVKLIRETNPEANLAANVSRNDARASSLTNRPSPSAIDAQQLAAPHISRSSQRNVSSRDPSMPLILRLDRNQMLLLHEESSQNGSLEGNERHAVSPMLHSSRSQTSRAAHESAAPDQRTDLWSSSPKSDEGSAAVAPLHASRLQAYRAEATPVVHDYVSREQRNDLWGSAQKREQEHQTPRQNASSSPTHQSENDGMGSFDTNYTPLSSKPSSLSAQSLESRVFTASSTPTLAHLSRIRGVPVPDVPEMYNPDQLALSASSSPGSASSKMGSQSLISDDVEAKRKILAEVCTCVTIPLFNPAKYMFRFAVKSSKSMPSAESAKGNR
jgi:hypothetical protein